MRKDLPLLVIGAGPKAAALGAKSKALRDCGEDSPLIQVIERTAVAANWIGDNGYTSGKLRLGTPPEKDVGFPYRPDPRNPDVTRTVLKDYSWISYKALTEAKYGEWIDRGRPHPTHEEWGRYIHWVLSQSETSVTIASIYKLIPQSDFWEVEYIAKNKEYRDCFSGIVVTGPGKSKIPVLKSDLEVEEHPNILFGDNFWNRLDVLNSIPIHKKEDTPIVVVGGGETAASIVSYLIDHFHGKPAPILILTRTGTIFSRGEGYYENKVFTDTGQWHELPQNVREEIIRRGDRGVFSIETSKKIAFAENVSHQHMEVVEVNRNKRNKSFLTVTGKDGRSLECSLLIFALGFDTFWFKDLLPLNIRNIFSPNDRISKRIERSIQPDLSFNHKKLSCKLYLPMLAGVTQGPGFPNLSCLGDLSDRILARR